MTLIPQTYAFKGGLDLASAALAVPGGYIISGLNYEPVAEGYARVQGFERFDGRTAPSAAQFWTVTFVSGTTAIVSGDVVTGGTSGATGVVAMDPVSLAGDWGAGTARGTLVLTNVVGTFQSGEDLEVSAAAVAVATSDSMLLKAADPVTSNTYLGAAQDYYRALIQKVPGADAVRGVHVLDGEVYAWRDSASTAYGIMYKATTSGWVAVNLGSRLAFTAGLVEVLEGQTVVGNSSGATGVAKRVVRSSGSWGVDAAGFIVFNTITGTFTPGETLKVGATSVATGGATTANTLPKGGHYAGINHNFYGASNRYAAYVCNGVGPAFEFDGTTFCPILTGMPTDAPTRIFEIANHLGLTFPGGSVQVSSIGEPVLFNAVTGAAEIGLGTEVTDVLQATETAVILFGEKKVATFTGTDSSTFALQELTEEAGALPWTAQSIGKHVYVDARGLRDVSATQAFGNFKVGLLSEIIEPLFREKKKAGITPILSYVVRSKSQYRLIWSDRSGLTVYMGRKTPEAIPFSTDDVDFTCVATGEMADGEGVFAGAADGYVYRIDSGTSFDGTGVTGFVMTPFNHIGSIMQEKNLRKTTVELKAGSVANIGLAVMFNYGDGEQPRSSQQDVTVYGSGGVWNVSTVWNEFHWSAPLYGKAEAYTEGLGVNMAAIIASESQAAEAPHTLQAYTFHILKRKVRR